MMLRKGHIKRQIRRQRQPLQSISRYCESLSLHLFLRDEDQKYYSHQRPPCLFYMFLHKLPQPKPISKRNSFLLPKCAATNIVKNNYPPHWKMYFFHILQIFEMIFRHFDMSVQRKVEKKGLFGDFDYICKLCITHTNNTP